MPESDFPDKRRVTIHVRLGRQLVFLTNSGFGRLWDGISKGWHWLSALFIFNQFAGHWHAH